MDFTLKIKMERAFGRIPLRFESFLPDQAKDLETLFQYKKGIAWS